MLRSQAQGVAALSLDESASFTAPSAFGPFRVLHQIGSGVLGPVFRTYEPQRDRLIAVKAFRLDLVPEDVARLADALRRLAAATSSHPAVVPAVDAGLEGATAFLAMDYVAGETLDVAFRHLAPAPLDRALPVIEQIADALDAGWATGLGHGALHPRDVFLASGANDVRVTGIGVVAALESTGIKAPVRRPYTAPERVAGEGWDVRADVYSLGAIAHELLTRRRPAGAGEQDGALATGLTPEQRVHVRRILSAALAERPEHRFATPRALADALAAVARHQTPILPPEPEGIAALPSEGAVRKRAPAPTPLLEVMDAAPEDGPDTLPSEAGGAVSAPVLLPPVSETSADAPLEHFARETEVAPPSVVPPPRAPQPARPPDRPRPAAEVRPQPDAAASLTPAPADHATISPSPEPFSSRARSVPPPTFLTPAPAAPSFPWLTLVACTVVGIAIGAVGGYQFGRRQAPPAAVDTSAPPRPAPDTEVKVPPAPVTTPVPEPVVPRPAPANASDRPETNPPPARPATPAGVLTVRSVPSGALVTVDGRPHGTTPATVRELSLGSHTLQVARPGFVPSSQPVVLTAAQPSKEISVELQASPLARATTAQSGTLFVDTRPRGARVIVDGHDEGATPLRLAALRVGEHAVRIELAGYKPVSTTVGIKPGAETPLTLTLELVGAPAGAAGTRAGAWLRDR